MIAEAVLARVNERRQRARGGVEPPGDVYGLMRCAYPGAFSPDAPRDRGEDAFALCRVRRPRDILLRKSIEMVGHGHARSRLDVSRHRRSGRAARWRGPYRLVRHPNYFAVVGELVGAALMTEAWIAGPVALAGFGALLARRIQVEDRALVGRV